MIRLTRRGAVASSGGTVASTSASAGATAGTGAAGATKATISVPGTLITGTGAANLPSVLAGKFVSAENASGTGSSGSIKASESINASTPSGTGSAGQATAGPTVWSPTTVSNLYAWYDASDTATITASSNLVSQWDDKSGNARHLTQPTSARRPDSGTRTMNSLNVIDFDKGNNEFLRKTSFSLSQPFTFFAVVLADVYDSTGRYLDGYDNSVSGRAILYKQSVWTLQAGAAVTTGRSGTTGSGVYHTVVFNGSSSLFRENGVQYGGSLNPGTGNVPQLNISSDGVGGGPWDGAVAEFFVYSAVISGTDLTNAESYLATKWGL